MTIKKCQKEIVRSLNQDIMRIKKTNFSDEKKINKIHKLINKKMRKIYLCER